MGADLRDRLLALAEALARIDRRLERIEGALAQAPAAGQEWLWIKQAAEYAGLGAPYAFHHLLRRADWDADAARDLLRGYVMEDLADSRQGVLVVDETGFLKKGSHSAGVQRQYCGAAGRIENGQVGAFLAFAGRGGRAVIDPELYLPQGWANDPARRKQAGVPEPVTFATEPALGQRVLQRAYAAGARAKWVTADEACGNDSKFRRFLEANGQPYVGAEQSNQRLWVGLEQVAVSAIADGLPRGRGVVAAPASGQRGRGCMTGRGGRSGRWTGGAGGCG